MLREGGGRKNVVPVLASRPLPRLEERLGGAFEVCPFGRAAPPQFQEVAGRAEELLFADELLAPRTHLPHGPDKTERARRAEGARRVRVACA